jgi:hypothetical protein
VVSSWSVNFGTALETVYFPAYANVETVAIRRLGASGKLVIGIGANIKNALPGQQKSVADPLRI